MTGFFRKLLHRAINEPHEEVRRTITHRSLGALQFIDIVHPRGGRFASEWRVTPPGFARYISVDFADEEIDPGNADLAQLEQFIRNFDVQFEACRIAVARLYEQVVEKPLPASSWQSTFRLDSVRLPSAGDPGAEWEFSLWCEDAQHWFVVRHEGENVVDVDMEG